MILIVLARKNGRLMVAGWAKRKPAVMAAERLDFGWEHGYRLARAG